MSARPCCRAAAQALRRSRTSDPCLPQAAIAGPSTSRPILAPSRRAYAAVAYAPRSEARRAPQYEYYDDEEVEREHMSPEELKDIEQGLHPRWEKMEDVDGRDQQWEDEQWQGEEVSADGAEVEDGVWIELQQELRSEADSSRGKSKEETARRIEKEPPIPPHTPLPTPPAARISPRPPPPAPKPAPKPAPSRLSRAARSSTAPKSTSPIRPYLPLSTAPLTETHARPLLSRTDWRLSSPISAHPRSSRPSRFRGPPPLTRSTIQANLKQGHNKLVGVGVEPARVGWWNATMSKEEQWGWKVRIPTSEKGAWSAGELYIRKQERLLQLTEKAEEVSYLEALERSGKPWEREQQGITVQRAIGRWLTSTVGLEEKVEEKEQRQKSVGGGGGGGAASAKAVAAWRSTDGSSLGTDAGYKFENGTILRFTPLSSFDSSGPRPPISETPRYPQGTVLDCRDGELIVAFSEDDFWALDEHDEYRIDIGLDVSSYALQRTALESLYYCPELQREHNASHIESAQVTHIEGGERPPTLREWTLQGTDVRELIVPESEPNEEASKLAASAAHVEEDLDDHTPTAEVFHLPSPVIPQIGPALANPSSLFTDNQLINSWIKRHSRDGGRAPLSMTGDPVLRLNESQTRAVAMSLGERLSLIQGPPGTGKSQTIVSIIALLKLHFRIPQPILLAAPTHVSTDHLLSLLVAAGLNPLRSGKASKVREDLQQWTVERRREQHPLWERLEAALKESEETRIRLQELREAVTKKGGRERTRAEIQEDRDLELAYRKAWRRYIALEQRLYSSLFSTADVFCSTAMGSGASKVMSMVDFPIVFLDEAAMCTEPVTLIPLMKGAEHVTLIGDHKQLPAVVKSRDAVAERLHVSLFERLMVQQNVKSVLLDTQYRMRPAISAFSNLAFYKSALHDDPSVSTRPPAPLSQYLNPDLPSAFVSHSYPEASYRYSTRNESEAEIIVHLVGDLLQKNPSLDPSEIGIISPYYAQTRLLQDMFSGWKASQALEGLLGPRRAAQVSAVEVNTVDGFQGREKGIIILSTVRSNADGKIGFLTDQRRLNVALTRARDAIFVVGNQRTLRKVTMSPWQMADEDADGGVWRRYLNWLQERKLIVEWKAEEGERVVQERVSAPVAEVDEAQRGPDTDEYL